MVAAERVRTRAQLAEFITLPRRLYAGMPGYVGPLDYDRRQMLDPSKSAFFTHGIAAYWIARRNGAAVGRVSAQIDFAAIGSDANEIGLFGCLDAIDDGEVVAGLLKMAEDWLRERQRRLVRGPFLLSINGEPGLLVEGQQHPPVVGLGWHPAYLGPRVEAAGYSIATKLLCYSAHEKAFAADRRLERLDQRTARANITVRPLNAAALESEKELMRRIFNDAWRQNWGFTPATESDVEHLIRNFQPFIFSDAAFFVDVGGKAAAVFLSIPNISEITADLGPAPSALGWLRLLYRMWRQRYRCFRVALAGITQEYQDSFLGHAIVAAAFAAVRRSTQRRRLDELVAGWILEHNHAMIQPLVSLGFQPVMTYNLYEKALDMDSIQMRAEVSPTPTQLL